MLERAKERFGLQPVSVTADKSYGMGEFCLGFRIGRSRRTPRFWIESSKQTGLYTQHDFIHIPEGPPALRGRLTAP
jgi:hypothetical protein